MVATNLLKIQSAWRPSEAAAAHEDSKTSLGDVTLHTASIPALDTSLYSLTSKEAAFFKTQTGIYDDDQLKAHILEVQAKAYKASHFNWISSQLEVK
jgi:hypothetical protein